MMPTKRPKRFLSGNIDRIRNGAGEGRVDLVLGRIQSAPGGRDKDGSAPSDATLSGLRP